MYHIYALPFKNDVVTVCIEYVMILSFASVITLQNQCWVMRLFIKYYLRYPSYELLWRNYMTRLCNGRTIGSQCPLR